MVKTQTPSVIPGGAAEGKQNAPRITSGVVVLTIALEAVNICIIVTPTLHTKIINVRYNVNIVREYLIIALL